MKTEPLQSLGPERVVASQHCVRHTPQPPDATAAPAVPAVIAPRSGCGPCCFTIVGGLTIELTDGDGCVWSCGLPAHAAGAPPAAARAAIAPTSAHARFPNIVPSFRCHTPGNGSRTVALPDQRTQDGSCGQVLATPIT